MATLERRIVRHQPLPSTGLRLDEYEAPMENMLRHYPFGLVSATSTYQDTVHHLCIDYAERDHVNDLYKIDLPKADQSTPGVNMVAIHQLLDDSLHNILDESLDAYSDGSTKTVSSCPLFR